MYTAAYIALGMVPFEWACRHAVDSLVIQTFPKLNQQKFALPRKVVEAFLVYGVSLGIALAVPSQSAKIIAVTGIHCKICPTKPSSQWLLESSALYECRVTTPGTDGMWVINKQ